MPFLRLFFRLRIVLLVFLVGSGAAKPLDILFVGNSYVYVNDLPGVLSKVVKDAGHEKPRVVTHAVGGQNLAGHCKDPKLLKLLKAPFDIVVLQEQSMTPAIAETDLVLREAFLNACQQLSEIARKPNPKVRVILYQTWARNPAVYNYAQDGQIVGGSAPEMQRRLNYWYREAALRSKAETAPVGEVWTFALKKEPSLPLYASDGSHPNLSGNYLTALVFMRTIFDAPVAIRYTGKLSSSSARRLQQLVNDWYLDPASKSPAQAVQ